MSQMEAFPLDLWDVMGRTVADLYSHLITRPTGRAVRLAIERQLMELDRPVLSQVDFSSVSVLDYSCADEVVARLLLAVRDGTVQAEAWFLFRGVRDFHRDPIEAALERHGLRAVLESPDRGAELMGAAMAPERRIWERVEELGRVASGAASDLLYRDAGDSDHLERLLSERLLYRHPGSGDLLSLRALARSLEPAPEPPSPDELNG
jgi:hypothetical protein